VRDNTGSRTGVQGSVTGRERNRESEDAVSCVSSPFVIRRLDRQLVVFNKLTAHVTTQIIH